MRRPRPNPPYAGPTMPLPEEVFAALHALALRNGVAGTLARGRPTLADVTEFLDYIRAALVAIPYDGKIVLDEDRDDVRWPDEMGLSETQGWLACEATWETLLSREERSPHDAGGMSIFTTLMWCDNEFPTLPDGGDGDEVPRNQDDIDEGVRSQIGRVYLSLRERGSSSNAGRLLRIDEPAYILHRHVPRELWDDMMASGQWSYPTTTKGKFRTRQEKGSTATWQFIGMDHPTVAPEDRDYWLPGGRKKRRRARPRRTRVVQNFRIGDRVVYAGDAIPRDWIGVVTTHEPDVEPQHHYNVRWTTPANAQGRTEQHEGLYHQSELIDADAESYVVIWDNGHSSGRLSGVYRTEAEAEAAGEDWRAEMLDIETTPEARAEAEEVYSFDVVPRSEAENT